MCQLISKWKQMRGEGLRKPQPSKSYPTRDPEYIDPDAEEHSSLPFAALLNELRVIFGFTNTKCDNSI
jgi:hypothetical protein